MRRQDFSSRNQETYGETPSMDSEEDTFKENKEAAAELTSLLCCSLSVQNGCMSDLTSSLITPSVLHPKKKKKKGNKVFR